jgi:hypothetical protein
MSFPNQSPHPTAAITDQQAGAPSFSIVGTSSSRPPFYFPELGDQVRFKRSPTHHPETGIVRGRMFGSRAIEIVDMGAKPLLLDPSQYEVIRT